MTVSLSYLAALFVSLLLRVATDYALIVTTGATLCGLSFTAGTILLRKPLFLRKDSSGEKWLRSFLARAYSLGIDTNYHRIGVLHKRYTDEFSYHEFPNFGVDRYSGIIPRTRPNFDFGRFLAQELGSSMTVDHDPQPVEKSKVIEISSPIARLWSKIPIQIRSVIMSARMPRRLRYRFLELGFPRYGRTQYNTVSYTLYPAKVLAERGEEASFEPGIAAEWDYNDIKRFEGKFNRFGHFLRELQFHFDWYYLYFRRLPSMIRHRSAFARLMLSETKKARRKDMLIWHKTREIRSLHRRLLFSRPEGFLTERFLTIITFVFDRDLSNHVEVYLTDSELQLTSSLGRFANSMLNGAISFGAAAVLVFLNIVLPQINSEALYFTSSFLGLSFYGYGWIALFRGLFRFRRYFTLAKVRENVSFTPDLRCPSCKEKVSSDSIHCIHCGSRLSTLPPPKPKITQPPPAELDKLSPDRWERFAVSARREYEGKIARISRAIGFRVVKESDDVKFRQFPQRFLVGPEVLVDAYSEGDTYTSPEIVGLGRNIAIAEEKYVVECLLKGIANKTTLDEFTADGLARKVREFNLCPEAVFVPHEYMLPIMMSKFRGIEVTRKGSDEFLSIDDIGSLPLVWSTQYLQFKEVVFLEKALGEWIVKPDEKSNRLWVNVAPERKERKFDVTVKSVAEYVVRDPTKGLVVEIRKAFR